MTNTFNNRLEPTQFQAVSPVPLTLLNLSYSYDQGSGKNNGSVVQITNVRDSTRTAAYTYDQVNRLSTAQTPSAATWGDSYVYDAWGNLLQKNIIKGTSESMTLTVNNKNQVTTPAFTYDAAGNVTWDTTNALKYDAEGRMNPLSGVTYTYDGDGRRVQKSDGTLYWVDDAFRPLSVGTTTGSITRDYIFLGGKRIAFVPLSSGNAYYYLSDHLGSDTVVASGDGKTIQWEGEFFPFGAQRTVITNLADNPYEFTGYEYDSGTGYNYAVARFDAGRWGRFLSPDPYLGSINISDPQSMNRYSYVQNNAINAIDPWGLASHGSVPDSGVGIGDTEDFESEFCFAFGVGCQSGGSGTKSDGGGGSGNDPNIQTSGCFQPNLLQRIGIKAQQLVAKAQHGPVGFGVGGSGGGGNIFGAMGGVSAQMWVFPNGQAALVYSWGTNTAPMSPTGIGVTHGVGGVVGFQASFSNAKTIGDLHGRSVDGGGGVGYGVGASVDASLALDGSTFQRNYTIGAGFGGWGGGIVFQNNKVVPVCSK